MNDVTIDPMQRKREADRLLDETAASLKEMLRSAAAQLGELPVFPGTLAVQAIECDPPKGAGPERGCVVVMADGELYELEIGVDFKELSESLVPDMFYARREKVTKLEDLHPLDYIGYAYNGLRELTRILLERGIRGL
jgi:hypothetical protein